MKKIIVIALGLILVGCSENHNGFNPNKPNRSENVTSSGYKLETLKHDGHFFIVFGSGNRGGIIHHPSCDCLR